MKIKVAVVQATPVFFDLQKTIEKIEQLVIENAQKGCQLILFPESFLPGYPRGFSFGVNVGKRTPEGRDLFLKYWKASLEIGSPEFFHLEKIAKENKVYLVVGATERRRENDSLYCSMFYFSPKKGLLGVHRKIKPTGTERLIWAEAGGEDLTAVDTSIGKLGGLICWENYMPLARMTMYQQGVQIYLAPTADARDTWISTMQHIACEGRCFVLGCNQFVAKSDIPNEFQQYISEEPEILCRGGSVIVSPMGKIIGEPLFDQEGVLIADLDLEDIVRSKLDFDVVGHYARPDIFHFHTTPSLKIIEEKNI